MNLSFRNKKLQKYAEDETLSVKKLGYKRSHLYMKRISDLIAQ